MSDHFTTLRSKGLNMNKRNSIYEECCDYKSMGNFTLTERVRHSCPEVFCKNGVLRNFAKLTVKYLCQSLFFNEVADFKPATLLKKGLWHRCFLVNFAKFLGTAFSIEHLRWLLLVFLNRFCQHSVNQFCQIWPDGKNFPQLIVSIFLFPQYFFNRFCPVEKCWVTPHCLNGDSLTLTI